MYVYRISKGGVTNVWTADLKNGKGSIERGEPKTKADVEFTMSGAPPASLPLRLWAHTLSWLDDDFAALITRKSDPQKLFMSGKLKLK